MSNSSNNSCPATEPFLQQNRPTPYRTSSGVNTVHRRAPRFGRTSNITAVIVNDADSGGVDADEYLKGILVSALIIFFIVAVWLTALMVLKFSGCCCGGRMRILAGNPPVATSTSTDVKKAVEEEEGGIEPAFTTTAKEQEETPIRDAATVDDDDKVAENEEEEEEGDAITLDVADTTTTLKDTSKEPGVLEEEEEQGDDVVLKQQGESQQDIIFTRMLRLRMTALLAGMGIFICCVLAVIKGLEHLRDSVDNSGAGFMQGNRLALEGADLLARYEREQTNLVRDLRDVVPRINTFCPNVRDTICDVDTEGRLRDACNFTDIPLADLLQSLNLPEIDVSVVVDELAGIREDLMDLAADLDDYETKVDEIEWPFDVAKVFCIGVAILDVLLMICVVQAWRRDAAMQRGKAIGPPRKIWRILKSWGLLPMFLLFVVLCWIFSMAFTMGSITMADMCYQNPDSRILAFVDSTEEDTLVYNFAKYYIDRCAPDRAPFLFDEIADKVLGVLDTMTSFLNQVQDSADEVEEICGPGPNTIIVAAEVVRRQLCLIVGTIYATQFYFSCDNWYPLYEAVAHDAVCNDAASGFHWLATTQFLIVIFSLILLTVRAALYEMPSSTVNEEKAEPTLEKEDAKGSNAEKDKQPSDVSG
jgi:hypothetical protein